MTGSGGHLQLVGGLRFRLGIRDSSVTVALRGDLDSSSSPRLRLHLLSLAGHDDGPAAIVVDLAGVTSIDRAGIEPLVEAHRQQVVRGAGLRLGPLSPPVIRFLGSEKTLADLLTEPSAPPGSAVPPEPETRRHRAEPEVPDLDVHTCRAMLAEIAQLKEALATRDVIGQAKGVIGLLYGCDQDAAFAVLRRISQDTNRKLRDVAVLIARSAAGQSQLPTDIAVQLRAPEDSASRDLSAGDGPSRGPG